MPYALRKLPNSNFYQVINKKTGHIIAKKTTKSKGEKQIRLLYYIENNGGKTKTNKK